MKKWKIKDLKYQASRVINYAISLLYLICVIIGAVISTTIPFAPLIIIVAIYLSSPPAWVYFILFFGGLSLVNILVLLSIIKR